MTATSSSDNRRLVRVPELSRPIGIFVADQVQCKCLPTITDRVESVGKLVQALRDYSLIFQLLEPPNWGFARLVVEGTVG